MTGQQQRRIIVLMWVTVAGTLVLLHMISTKQWAELITALLGIAGFILMWDLTEQTDE